MEHLIENRGQDVYCHRCGKCWDVGDEVPECEVPRWQAPAAIPMNAYLVGCSSAGTNPCLVLAQDKEDAIGAISRPLGIHPSDLVAIPARQVAPIASLSSKAWWVINPVTLEIATKACAELLATEFPGADRIVNPFKITKRK